MLHVAPPKFLNIARSAGPRWILGVLNPQEINFLAEFALHGIFAKIMIFHENLKFHHHEADLDTAWTFHQKFFRSSPFQNLNPHNLNWGWTEGNWKRLTGFCAQTKNVKKQNQKNRPKSWPKWPRQPKQNITFQDGNQLWRTVSTN